MVKIALDIGHNCPPDTGAVKLLTEDDLNMEIGLRLITAFENHAQVQILNVLPNQANSVANSLKQRTNKANALQCDYYISLHHNASNGAGHGCEVFYYSESQSGKDLAQILVDKIATLGFRNRGAKTGDHLFVVNSTQMPAVLIEFCFIDNQSDVDLWNAESLSRVVQEGIFEFLGLPSE